MKTKFILTAMCLPLAFAACTNEDVLVENQNALEGKKVVDFKVSATYGADGAESRMVNNNGTFLWEGTDVLGAAWNLDGGIYSNNKFVNTLTEASATADFTTQATTVVGDYVFYYPYNTDVTKDLNSGIVYSLPEPQEYDPTGEKMMNNNFMISPNIKVDGNEPGELTLPLTMRSIYAYGQLNLTLPEVLVVDGSNVNSVKIQKIIISYTSNVAKDGKIALANIPTVNLTADYIETLIAGESGNDDLDEACEGKTEAEVRAILFAAADKALTAQSETYTTGEVLNLTEGTAVEQVSITCVNEENPDGIALGKNETFSTRVLLPTANSTSVTIEVFTNKGKWVSDVMNNQKIKANHTANLANLNRVKNGETAFKMYSFTPITDEINAISEADFIASVKNLKAGSTAEVKVGDFVLTPDAVAAIPAEVDITFTSDVTFEGDMTLKNMTFGNVNLKGGKIELAEGLEADILDIEEAEVKITAEGEYTTINVNGGSLEVAAVNEDGEAVTFEVNALNVGDYTEFEPAEATLTVTNDLTANVNLYNGTKLINNANITELTINAKAEAVNNGTIETAENWGLLYNAGKIIDLGNIATVEMQEGGVILESSNNGLIKTVANSEVTTVNDGGEVIYVEGARVAATTAVGSTGYVTYVAPADFTLADFGTLNDCVTKILFNENVTFAVGNSNAFDMNDCHASIKAFEFKGNFTVTGTKSLTLREDSELIFTGVNSTVKIQGGLIGVGTIEVGVAENADTEEIEEVATNVTIVKGSAISGLKTVKWNSAEAQVWNEGTVTKASGATVSQVGSGYWKNKPIE